MTLLAEAKQTELFGEELGRRVFLRPHWGKCLFLSGELGIGKTTLLRGFARGLGVRENIASPSYALMSEYQIPKNEQGLKVFAHADVYRTEERSALGLSEMEEKIEDSQGILAVEWAEKIPPEFFPEKYIFLRMQRISNGTDREIAIDFHDPNIPSDTVVGTLIREFQTPVHIQAHIEKVTRVALFLAKKLIEKGFPVDIFLVRAAALLHDTLRMVNVPEIRVEDFSEEVTPEKRTFWEKQREKYGSQHHAFAIGSILRERGYDAVADVIEKHGTRSVLEEMVLEEQCLYIADRSVTGNTIVGVTKRFLEAARRNGHEQSPDFENIRERVFALEKSLFKKAGVTTEDILDLN